MSRARFPLVLLAALIIMGLVILGGFAIYRIGWSEGYRMGQLATGAGEGIVVAYAPYGPGLGGVLLTVGVVFLLLLVIGRFFRFLAWRAMWQRWKVTGGPKSEYWTKHWHRRHGPEPPWCWDWEEPAEEKAEKPEPDADTGNAVAHI
jgi:hypothetical protein